MPKFRGRIPAGVARVRATLEWVEEGHSRCVTPDERVICVRTFRPVKQDERVALTAGHAGDAVHKRRHMESRRALAPLTRPHRPLQDG